MENIPRTGYFTQKYKLILLFIHNILHLITCKKNTQKTIQNKCLSLILKIWCQWLQFCCCLLKVEKSFLWTSFFHISGNHVRLEHQYFFLHQYINIVLVLVPMTQWFVKRILKFWFLTGGRETMVSKYILWENHHGHYFPVKLTKNGTSNCIFYTRNKTVILYDLSAQ